MQFPAIESQVLSAMPIFCGGWPLVPVHLRPHSRCRFSSHSTFGFSPSAEVPRRILTHVFAGGHSLPDSAHRLPSGVEYLFASAGRCSLLCAVLGLPNVHRNSKASFPEHRAARSIRAIADGGHSKDCPKNLILQRCDEGESVASLLLT